MADRGAGRSLRAGTDAAICLLLALLTLAVFLQVIGHGFLLYDDPKYVTGNPHVLAGPTVAGLSWALTSTASYNWHPLTWLSHMLDAAIYGERAGGHHATSLLLHMASAIGLYLLLRRATGSPSRSALVAALFAVHPLHVESVAWVSERKDVLSGLFFVLTLGAWVRWAERPRPGTYALALAAFALGLMSKPMLVTLPIVLLLLDVWPLRRWNSEAPTSGGEGKALLGLLLEKVPFFLLAAAAGSVAVLTQLSGGAVQGLERIPLGLRLENAAVACVAYLAKTLAPNGLAVFYPHPGPSLPAWQIAGSAALLLVLTGTAIRLRARSPAILVGWCWYLVMLVPVVGIVQIGEQAMADRYTYLPLVGIFLAVAWAIPDGLRPAARGVAAAAAVVAVGTLAIAAWRQTAYWSDTETLFRHALAVTERNHRAHQVLAFEFLARGDLAQAEENARAVLAIRPQDRFGWLALGRTLESRGDAAAAIDAYRTVVRLDSGDAATRIRLGNLLARRGKLRESVGLFRDALALDPSNVEAWRSLAWALVYLGEHAEAWRQIRAGEAHGFRPPADLVKRLSAAMPEPEVR